MLTLLIIEPTQPTPSHAHIRLHSIHIIVHPPSWVKACGLGLNKIRPGEL